MPRNEMGFQKFLYFDGAEYCIIGAIGKLAEVKDDEMSSLGSAKIDGVEGKVVSFRKAILSKFPRLSLRGLKRLQVFNDGQGESNWTFATTKDAFFRILRNAGLTRKVMSFTKS